MALFLRTSVRLPSSRQSAVLFCRQQSTLSPEVVENSHGRSSPLSSKTNPAEFDTGDIGKFYEIPAEDMESCFHEGLCGEIEYDFERLGASRMMIRKPALAVIDAMKNIDAGSPSSLPAAVMLTGPRLSGKSATLNQAVHYARTHDWLTLVVPSARKWTMEGSRVTKLKDRWAFDRAEASVPVLEALLHNHADKLGGVQQRGSYGGRYTGSTLRSVVEEGIEDVNRADECLTDLKAELSQVTEHPVLIAVDQADALDGRTTFGFEGEQLTPDDLRIVRAFREIPSSPLQAVHPPLARGLSLFAMCERRAPSKAARHLPLYKVPRESRVTHNGLSVEETDALLDYLYHADFNNHELAPEERDWVRMMTGGCIGEVVKFMHYF